MRRATIPITAVLAVAAMLVPATLPCAAQTAPTREVGSVTAVGADSVTVKPDHGPVVTLAVPSGTRILETQPGAKTLAGATAIPLSAIAPGDRVFAIAQPSASGSGLTATMIIAMKASAIAQRHQSEEAAWQHNGIGGLVKSVDTATGTITIASGPRTLTIATTPQTVIRRYSPDSIAFSASTPSTLAAIHPGDQLRARGSLNQAGSQMTALAIVSGTFRNIAGTILSVDPSANTVTVRDLKTKKPIVIRITSESQMHEIPAPMARYLAARLRRDAEAAKQHKAHGGAEMVAGEHPEWRQPGQARRASISQMLARTPPVTIAGLHKGQALMIVATDGTPGAATAVTVLSGVEPILTAPASAAAGMFSASWNLNGSPQSTGGAGTGAGTGTGTGGTQQ